MRLRTFGVFAIGLFILSIAPASLSAAVSAPSERRMAARTMVQAAMVKEGDKVLITGSLRDNDLLEDLAIETLKAGGQPLIAISSDNLARRSFDEVPASFDSQENTLAMAMANTFDVRLSVETGETDNLMAGVPASRLAARARAGQPAAEAFLARRVRSVNLGNGLYPTAVLARRLRKTQPQLASAFWKASMVSPATIRQSGNSLLSALASGSSVRLSSANGTDITFTVAAANGFVSDGSISEAKMQQGKGATSTWLPAGELLVPVVAGSAEGKVVVDRILSRGVMVEGLTLVFSRGKLTSMTAKSGLAGMQALYDASSGDKDAFSYIDLGINPEANIPTNTGRIVWMAPGAVTIGMGDNTEWGGTTVSSFGFSGPITSATLSIDGRPLITKGVIQ
jgi:leucyl aminopeptidase (aminopeptidase T)